MGFAKNEKVQGWQKKLNDKFDLYIASSSVGRGSTLSSSVEGVKLYGIGPSAELLHSWNARAIKIVHEGLCLTISPISAIISFY